MHLIIDGFGGSSEKLASEELVLALLDRLPGSIGMHKISGPHVQRYAGDKPEDWGVSGFVLIAESHITIHTFPSRGILWADAFSCKAFDTDAVISEMTRAFGLSAVSARQLPRGLEYPHAADEAVPVAELGLHLVRDELPAVPAAAEARR
jgi:S-adenosylmethionine decarboxylase